MGAKTYDVDLPQQAGYSEKAGAEQGGFGFTLGR